MTPTPLHVAAAPSLAVLALSFFAGACSCPTNDSGVAVSPNKYAAERDAACAVVEGCTTDGMSDVRVYEVATQTEVAELCEIPDAWACYCYEAIGCHTIFLVSADGRRDNNALHEFVHAALDVIGIDTRNHGPLFEATLKAARTKREAQRR